MSYIISDEQVNVLRTMAKSHNESIDNFIEKELKAHFGSENISLSQWFEAQRLIKEQNFYEKGRIILRTLRAFGFDCKMNMQSEKLVCIELGIN